MPACWIKVISQILPQIGCHGNVPKGIKKEAWIEKIHANTFHLVKRSLKLVNVDEIALLKLKKKKNKKLTQAKWSAT